MADLEKIIGRDIKQAEKFAQGLDAAITRLQTEIKQLEDMQRAAHERLKDTAEKAREAWEYVTHLKEIENK